jgi:P27 family predicted phage terminase small subunit
MAKGRPKKPTALKVLEGNPGKRPLPVNEPKPVEIAPDCPEHLDDEAKKEWERIAPELESLGLLTYIDKAALAGYCQAWSRWVEAEMILKKHGILVKSPNGFPMQSPALAIANKAMEQIKEYLVEFGMSPASRTRVKAQKSEKSKGISGLLSG